MTAFKKHVLSVGPFCFSVSSNINQVNEYLHHHYRGMFIKDEKDHFVDFDVSIEHGPTYRRVYKPQTVFGFNGKKPFKPLPLDQAPAMLEWGMNWVISSSAHQFLLIHAATVEKDGKGLIISAPSGSGKSTLCAYLVSQGWRLLSDELAMVSLDTMMLYGLGRPISLKNKSIPLMQSYFDSDDFSPIVKDTHKGTISLLRSPVESSLNIKQPVEPKRLVFVKYNKDEVCHIEKVDKCFALTEVIQNSFNFGLLGKTGFDCARRLIEKTPAVYIEYNSFKACENAILDSLNKE